MVEITRIEIRGYKKEKEGRGRKLEAGTTKCNDTGLKTFINSASGCPNLKKQPKLALQNVFCALVRWYFGPVYGQVLRNGSLQWVLERPQDKQPTG